MGTGYTRNDVSNNIADGNIISASDIDGEYDAIEAAFNSSTGHTHDGTSAEGGPITVVGPVQDLVVSATEVKPKTTNTLDLGTSALLYKDAYLQGNMYFRDTALKIVSSADGQLDIDADVEVEITAPTLDIDASTAVTIDTATLTITGSANVTGDLDIDNININGNTIISTNTNGNIALTPNGTGEVDISKVDIASGEIDGTTIGANSAAAGTFTNLTSTGTSTHATVDINGGNIDGTTIGASSAAAITGTTITGTSFVTSGDMTFGDNDKAIFGAGSDLQIYHDGTNSFITDAGTGVLILRGSTAVALQGANGENCVLAYENGEVQLRYDNTTKLATTATGVDVTGTITSDGLTVDGTDTEATTSQLLKVRNSTTGEAVTIGLYAKADNGGDGNSGSITFDAGADGSAANNELRFSADHQTDTNPALGIAGNGDVSLYASDGTTQGFFWDASTQRLGLGTTSPSFILDATGDVDTWVSRIYNTGSDANAQGLLVRSDATAAHDAFVLGVYADSGYKFAVKSSGNVGIGTTSPAQALHVNSGASNEVARFESTDVTAYLSIIDNTTSNPLQGIGSVGDNLTFYANNGERMRIDSSGNLLVGTTDTSVWNNSAGSNADFGFTVIDNGYVAAASYNQEVMYLNRTGSDGSILQFRKDGSTVGSIGAWSSSLLMGTGDVGLAFVDGTPERIQPRKADDQTSADGLIDLGHTSNRFKDLYLSGGAYLGGTGSANYLDDYEEGTWTPTPISLTTSGTVTYTGTYTKIGRFVFGLLTVISSGGTTTATADTTRFSGLPFTSDSINGMALSINTSTTGSTAAGQVSGTTLITGGWSAASSIRMSFWYTST